MEAERVVAVLEELDIESERVLRLTGNQRARLLNFLLRWDHIEAVHACLDVLIPLNPTLVSLLDLRVRAFLAQGQPDEALEVMQERLELRTSLTARSLLARVHLARGDVESAYREARALVEERAESVGAWGLLGEMELARGDTDAALAAYRHQNKLRPQGRAYFLGMIALYQARDDWVTASGYAVRLLRTAEGEGSLPVSYQSKLREYFQASGEATRVAQIEAELAGRYSQELEMLQAELSRKPGERPSAVADARRAPSEKPEAAPEEFLPTFDQVAVSDEERARITEVVRRLFGFETLLPGQTETLACVMRGEDVLTILPTGGGKSLCYQLPALLAEQGTTLVISPLIALMKDQVDSLPAELRQRATTINSSLQGSELHRRLGLATKGGYRLIYAAPERLRQPTFLHALRRAGVSRLVIDEAHCVSVWGHDFRPDYLTIGRARQVLGSPALLAMTATAPPRVRRDILHNLGSMRVIAGDVTRPNLQLEVFYARNADEKLRHLLAFCRAEPGSGIIYAGTRARCEELAALLRQQSIAAGHYHAGISDRAQAQDDFMSGSVRVVVATVAFGMGIDKPDIRFIVHFVPPPSVESYYQEAGRAGRDGLPARCLLMYASSDRATLTRRAKRDIIPIEFLRGVYSAVRRRLGEHTSGRVAGADLERDLGTDSTRVRVAISLLEQVELLRRGPDLPRSATIRLMAREIPAAEPQLAAFCQAARLQLGQALDLDLADVACRANLPLAEIESLVLKWADAGWLHYRPSQRDMLLELLPPPPDATRRIELLLERYETINAQRVDEIAAYAGTRRCRHGHLNAYLGGRTIELCTACDNCIEIAPPPEAGLPGERDQLLTILRCISDAPWSWGRRTLTRILRGDEQGHAREHPLHQRARGQASFGSLAFRSGAALDRMLNSLEHGGFLGTRNLDHGGVVLDLTSRGKAALQNPAALDGLLPKPKRPPKRSRIRKPSGKKSAKKTGRKSGKLTGKKDAEGMEIDEALLQALRAWRRKQAKAQKVPLYYIFQSSLLSAIAAHMPVTLEALSELKGIGPHKLEQYGAEVIELVREYRENR